MLVSLREREHEDNGETDLQPDHELEKSPSKQDGIVVAVMRQKVKRHKLGETHCLYILPSQPFKN